jgi:hypothetical protein
MNPFRSIPSSGVDNEGNICDIEIHAWSTVGWFPSAIFASSYFMFVIFFSARSHNPGIVSSILSYPTSLLPCPKMYNESRNHDSQESIAEARLPSWSCQK